MREHEINKLDNFICGWYIDDTSICDDLIEHHKNSNDKSPGTVGFKGKSEIIPKVKESTDVVLIDENLVNRYAESLSNACDLYIEKYPWVVGYDTFTITEYINIQHYRPGGGYFSWHTERNTDKFPISTRHMVFMTYLNDVSDGGETEFYHQKLKVKPEKGLTIIWPADWTFTHRGVVSPSQDKWIITGWYNFCSKLNK
jgi:prolyl 4-hydroxylase